MAKEMLVALEWSCIILLRGFKEASSCTGDPFQKLVEAQSCLYTKIIASKSKKLSKKANERYALLFIPNCRDLKYMKFSKSGLKMCGESFQV